MCEPLTPPSRTSASWQRRPSQTLCLPSQRDQSLLILCHVILPLQLYCQALPQHLPQLVHSSCLNFDDSTMTSKIYHVTPIWFAADPCNDIDTTKVEPNDEELSNADWIEVADREWDDEQLMDDARPGRRTVKVNTVVRAEDRSANGTKKS
jgi:hypothetical protein